MFWAAVSSLILVLQASTTHAQYFPPIDPDFEPQPPLPVPEYMVDNTGNTYGFAPDRNIDNGPVVQFDFVNDVGNFTTRSLEQRDGGFWVNGVAHGQSPFAGTKSYKVFRNVKDYGAKGDGKTDDTKAINDAIVDGNRCGQACGQTSTLGAIVYFPPGTYMISSPVIQYYYTQFIGDISSWPTIKGTSAFKGIALIDTDVYIPGGNGAEWYINQNQFFRSIRNFNLDITNMKDNNTAAGGQNYVPTCLHWQVAQATSLQNIHFIMIQGSDKQVGIFMENGSGGFLSDLNFFGGQIGFRAGSQQYTLRGLNFVNTATAISMIWNWGMVWKEITIKSAYVAIDTQSFGGIDGQGTGSLVIQDSSWDSVQYGITLKKGTVSSAIVIENLQTTNCPNIVMNSGYNDNILRGVAGGSFNVASWALGFQYTNLSAVEPTFAYGNLAPAPSRPAVLVDSKGHYFTRSRPQYDAVAASAMVNVLAHGVVNDGTGDQTSAINSVLSSNVGSVIYFPAGVYAVQGTVHIPVGSKITGELWPQIMATGTYFQDAKNPQVMVQVGNSGDSGIMEISGMLFTVQGPTAGCILMEWNVHEKTQGSAGMWDSHFRVGGAAGSKLTLKECLPNVFGAVPDECLAAAMHLHVTRQASGYFENNWVWTADHDMDVPVNGSSTTANAQISVFSARGILVESQGPVWFYGSSSEHHQYYQYQLSGAKNVYMGHIQTETPYYQPVPAATNPLPSLSRFANDPAFEDCVPGSYCTEAWALRVLNSSNVFIYGAGLYSFFNDYQQTCLSDESCQQRLIDIGYTQGLWMFNIFTKGAVEAISPQGGILPILSDDTQAGFTTEIAVYVAFGLEGGDLGGRGVGTDHNTPDNVSILPLPGCTTVAPSATFTLAQSCIPAITNLPSTGPSAAQQNRPPGPSICHEVCDIWRLLTGTCCGIGGTLGNPVYIPPSVSVPYDIPLPSGYTPSNNITIPVPGFYDPEIVFGTRMPSTTPGATSVPTGTSAGGNDQSSTTYPPGAATGTAQDPDCSRHECGCIPAGTPVEIYPSGVPLPAAITIPARSCFPGSNDGGGGKPPSKPCPNCPPGGLVVPPGSSLPGDPPCYTKCKPCRLGACPDGESENGNDSDGQDDCKPPLSAEIGLCPNGNFPLYIPEDGTISCDVPDEEVPRYLSECQEEADENLQYFVDEIECEDDSCPLSSKRSTDALYMLSGKLSTAEEVFGYNLTKRQSPAPKKPKNCAKKQPPSSGGGEVKPGGPSCDVTFECDTDIWPNVCNNALSAQMKRAKPTVLTYQGPGARPTDVTKQWWRTHKVQGSLREDNAVTNGKRDMGTLPGQPFGGWGLIGCEVEEYPFGNAAVAVPAARKGIFADRAVLRLIPWNENRDHGIALGFFIRNAIKYGDPSINPPKPLPKSGGWTYCVEITGGRQDPVDFLLGVDQTENRCGQAYGPGYLLMNDISAKEAQKFPNEPRWDPWFDSKSQLFPHTVYSSGAVIATKLLPSQYGKLPAPGMKTYVNDVWTTVAANGVTVGTPAGPGVPGSTGQNLKYDAPGVRHAGILFHNIDIEDLGYDPRITQAPEPTAAPQASNRSLLVITTAPSITSYIAQATSSATFNAPQVARRAAQSASEAHQIPDTKVMDFGTDLSGNISQVTRSQKRTSVFGGSFLDPRVYEDAVGCERPWQDPCLVEDCWEGGVVYDANGNVASDGSADQSGPNGEDTGDNGDNGVLPTSTSVSSPSTAVSTPSTAESSPSTPTPTPIPTPFCVTAHTESHQCVIDAIVSNGDATILQLWENGVEVTCGYDKGVWASSNAQWNFVCSNGGTARVTDNGQSVLYKNANGWSMYLPSKEDAGNGVSPQEPCFQTEKGGSGVAYDYEYVFATEGCATHGCPTFSTCNFRGPCKFDGACFDPQLGSPFGGIGSVISGIVATHTV